MIVVFPDGTSEIALSFALRVHHTIRHRLLNLPVRIGVHEGIAVFYQDTDEKRNVVGQAINICQRVMDVGDANHILLSETSYQAVKNLEWLGGKLFPLKDNPVEVKHYLLLNIFGYYDGIIGNNAEPIKLQGNIGLRAASIGRSVEWSTLLDSRQKLKMIDISMPLFGQTAVIDYLDKLLWQNSQLQVQVLLLNPASIISHIRKMSRAYKSMDELHTTLEYVVKIVSGFRKDLLGRYGLAVANRFDVRLYETTPTISAFITDEHVCVNFYVEHLTGSRGPFFSAVRQEGKERGKTLYDVVEREFDSIWEDRSIPLWGDDVVVKLAASVDRIKQLAVELEIPQYLKGLST
jgi:hypothetical protein